MDSSLKGKDQMRRQKPRSFRSQVKGVSVPSVPSHPKQHPVPEPVNSYTFSSASGMNTSSSRTDPYYPVDSAMRSCSLASRVQSCMPDELRLVLVGRTGAGKSATGNTILGVKLFKSQLSMSSVTKECKKESGVVQGQRLALIDTPGYFDTSLTPNEVDDELIRCLAMCSPGPHAFLLVIPITRFTDEQQKTIELIEKTFQDINNYIIIIFTHADLLKKEEKSIQQFILEQDKRIQDLLKRFGRRFLAFDNTDPKDQDQVTQLLKKLDELVAQNRYQHFTNQKIQIMNKALAVLEEKKEAVAAASINRAKQEVRKLGEEHRDNITKNLENDMQEIERQRLCIQGNISQIIGDLIKEQESSSPDLRRLKRLQESLQRKNNSLAKLDMAERTRINDAEEEMQELDLWIQEEEKKREEEEKAKASHGGHRWYQDPFYFSLLKYLVIFMGGAGFGFMPALLGFMAPAAAPVGLTAELAALIGPELASTLTAAVVKAGPLIASQCSIQ